MNSVEVLLVAILICSIYPITCKTIISSNAYYEDDDDPFNPMTNDMTIDDFNLVDRVSNLLETVYASQSFGKSHRFYFTQGERKEGN